MPVSKDKLFILLRLLSIPRTLLLLILIFLHLNILKRHDLIPLPVAHLIATPPHPISFLAPFVSLLLLLVNLLLVLLLQVAHECILIVFI